MDLAEAVALFNEGVTHLSDGRASAAELCFRRAIALEPTMAEAHSNLGLLMAQRGDSINAESSYKTALALNPALAQVPLNLGALLLEQKRFDEAEHAYRQALHLRPKDPGTWSNLGMLYACTHREQEAEECYRHSISLDPKYATAHFNLSYLLLRQARYKEGWACFEARDWYARLAAQLGFPRWQGEPLEGKTVLITCEAGHGDMIHFCRYARELKALGAAYVGVLCHPGLKRLFATLSNADEAIALGEHGAISHWDFWTPALSLPYFCDADADSIPAAIPYLQASPEDTARWAPRLKRKSLNIGLAWKGNPRFENDAARSIPQLSILSPLWQALGKQGHFISLQKGPGEDEISDFAVNYPITAIGSELRDFADTAAAIDCLDLVICVDTAVAHLAGALGKPCWLMLPDYKTDWRWQKNRTDSPWYPTIRLFRQNADGNWQNVVASIAASLLEFLKHHNADRE